MQLALALSRASLELGEGDMACVVAQLFPLFKLFGEGREGLREVPLSCCLNWGEIPTTSPFTRTLPCPKSGVVSGVSKGVPRLLGCVVPPLMQANTIEGVVFVRG